MSVIDQQSPHHTAHVGARQFPADPAHRRDAIRCEGNLYENACVVIIDADRTFQQGLRDLLKSVGLDSRAYGSVREFITERDLGDGPICFVVDVRLPELSGLEFQERLIRSKIKVPIVFLTGHADIPMTVRAMKSGAADFLTKPFREQELLDAVTSALKQDRGRRRELGMLADLHRRVSKLTSREREIMTQVASGRMNKQIAFTLGISEQTVKMHRGGLMRKLNARTLPDLVRIADAIVRSAEVEEFQHVTMADYPAQTPFGPISTEWMA